MYHVYKAAQATALTSVIKGPQPHSKPWAPPPQLHLHTPGLRLGPLVSLRPPYHGPVLQGSLLTLSSP